MSNQEKPKKRFEALDMADANNECRSRDAVVFDTCEVCDTRVGLHCGNCKVQVTGCLCTEVDRFGNDEAWKRAIDQFGDELAREKYRRAGLWVPGTPRLN